MLNNFQLLPYFNTKHSKDNWNKEDEGRKEDDSREEILFLCPKLSDNGNFESLFNSNSFEELMLMT